MSTNQLTKKKFFDEVHSYIQNKNSLDMIEKAYLFAEDMHHSQKRKSGEPYFVHLLNVAYELTKLKAGPKTICAGLLHDCMEDQGVTKEQMIEEFDEEVFVLVEAVTKIGDIKFKDENEYQAANHRKILFAMAKDVRVIIIKLVDRLHNMRTLEFQSEAKQKKIAKETLDVYAPIAHRLGIAEIEHELEDLAFFYLERENYTNIVTLLDNKKSERDAKINSMIEEISEILKKNNIKFRIFGRSKDIYSIHKKMLTKNKRFDEILDLLAIRIVTETELNCYEILGFIHATFHPIPGRFKDYIAMPKVNMYQSLHTTIVGSDGRIYEVQIRTEAMDEVAEKGIAAHWSYKEGRNYSAKNEQKEIQKELEWLKNFEEDYSDSDDPTEYMSSVTHDMFNTNVYAMTPKGRVIDLVSGSTPIDFAYRIHTEIGHQTVGAIVNGILVPLNTALKTGDVVELKTNKNSEPSADWLKIVKTSGAKNKIRAFLSKKENERREEYIKLGENVYRDDLKKRGLSVEEYMDHKKLETVYSAFQLSTYNEMMYAIACKSLSCQAIVDRLVKQKKNEVSEETIQQIVDKTKEKRKNNPSNTGVMVGGMNSMKTQLAPCCSPIYGDEIVGYVTKGKGIKVHRKDCPNIINEKARLIDAYWDPDNRSANKYEADIKIYSKDRNFLLTDIMTCLSQYKSNLTYVNSILNPEELTVTTKMRLVVEDLEHLNTIMANLRKVNSVISVERTIK